MHGTWQSDASVSFSVGQLYFRFGIYLLRSADFDVSHLTDVHRLMCGIIDANLNPQVFTGQIAILVGIDADEFLLLCSHAQRGKEADAFRMMKNCMLCGKCTMVCPRGINTRHLILSISRIYKMEDGK